jgi:hypothetical protein
MRNSNKKNTANKTNANFLNEIEKYLIDDGFVKLSEKRGKINISGTPKSRIHKSSRIPCQ